MARASLMRSPDASTRIRAAAMSGRRPIRLMEASQARGFGFEQSRQLVSQLVDSQATVITTINLFELFAAILLGAAAIIWIAPKPKGD